MRRYLSDRNLVIALFILVLITFSFAHEDSKQLQQFSTEQSLSADNNTPVSSKKIEQNSVDVLTKNSSGAVSR